MKPVQSWARRKQSLEDEQNNATTTTSATNNNNNGGHHHHVVADSGFSTEASNNSNTSPRSSRFDPSSSAGPGGITDHLPPPPPPPPVEKELVQHLERVQQRLARLRKDEDRLLTLLNPMRPRLASNPDQDDELMRLLDQIQIQGRTLKAMASSTSSSSVEKQETATNTATATATPPASPLPPNATAGKSTAGNKTLSREQVSAVLRLTNPVQLQRHLLRALLANEVTFKTGIITSPGLLCDLPTVNFFSFFLFHSTQSLKDEVETIRSDAAARDARWRSSSHKTLQQVTALRDENDDLRFQVYKTPNYFIIGLSFLLKVLVVFWDLKNREKPKVVVTRGRMFIDPIMLRSGYFTTFYFLAFSLL